MPPSSFAIGEPLKNVPRVSDGTIFRALDQLLMLDEERISYRALDVERLHERERDALRSAWGEVRAGRGVAVLEADRDSIARFGRGSALAQAYNNWMWRYHPGDLTPAIAERLKQLCLVSDRATAPHQDIAEPEFSA